MPRLAVLALLAACGSSSPPAVAPAPGSGAATIDEVAACGPGSELARQGRDLGYAQDYEGAVAMYQRSCAENDGTGCYFLGTAYNIGEGTSHEPARAEALFVQAAPLVDAGCQRGCQRDCATRGWTLWTGQGRAKDGPESIDVLTAACTAKSGEACFTLATMYGFGYIVEEKPDRAFHLYLQACDLGEALGCNGAASSYEQGEGIPANPTLATKLHERACKLGYKGSCGEQAP
jgi:uncharacterized protein